MNPGFNFISETLCRRVSVVELLGSRFIAIKFAYAPEDCSSKVSLAFLEVVTGWEPTRLRSLFEVSELAVVLSAIVL
jgi:hypothetical protein